MDTNKAMQQAQDQIAKAATVTVAPTGEVILVCAENHDTLLANIEKALAA